MSNKYESQKHLEDAIEKATESINKSQTGAACFKSIGFASCSGGITKEQAQKIANDTGTSLTFHAGKSCSEISCKA